MKQASEIFQMLRESNKTAPSLAARLAQDSQRFSRFSRRGPGLLLDYSRISIDENTFLSLMGLAESCGVEDQRDRMFRGERINFTEQRAVLHPVWRERNFAELFDAAEAARLEQATRRMRDIAAALHRGRLPGGDDGPPIRHLVHIGIGGSLLGPKLLCEAFPPTADCPAIHFLSSVDALSRERLLARLDPRETAVMLVSKSFTTSEVLLHANRIRQWQLAAMEHAEADRRLFAVTSAASRAEAFGVPSGQVLEMGEWTGGRFSVWSPVGVTAAVSMGADGFDAFLAGGAEMDRHFREAPPAENLPIIMGMLSVWHRNVCGYPVRGVIPYDGRLAGFPSWLQQVEMESNGKSVDLEGRPVTLATSPVVMGDCGTDAQHALFQAFHQGTGVVPLDFIGVIRPDHDDIEAQRVLLSHLLAQSTALAVGRDAEQATALMQRQGVPESERTALLPHRIMPGNRPSAVILLERLEPASLGSLMALYEHMVMVESVVWRINAFDQWGVELGKILADAIEPALADAQAVLPADIPGLEGVIDYIRECLPRP